MTKSLNKIKSLFERFKDLTALGFANIASSAISGIFWFYIASLLGTENYGEVSYFIAIAGITSTVSFLGSGNTIIIYTAKGEKIQSTIFFITIISSVIASFVLFFIFYNIGVSLYILGYTIFGLATAHILGQKLYKDYSKYLITQKILLIPFALAFYYLIGPQGVILGYAVSFFPYIFRVYKEFKESKIKLSILKPIRGFMFNSYVLDLSRTFSGQTDKIIIGPMLGFAMLGNYQLGIQFLSLLTLLPSIVYQYILPHDANGNPNKKLKQLTLLVSVFLAVAGISLSPLVLPVLFPKFTHAIHVIQIVSLAIIPLSINLVYISKFLGTEKSRIVLVGSGVYLVVQVLGILTLGKFYGVNGVATALVLATSSEAVYLMSISRFFQKDHLSPQQSQSSNKHDSNPQIGTSVVVEQAYNSEAQSSINFLQKGLSFFVRNRIISLLIIGCLSLFLRLYYFPWNIPITLDGLGYFWYAVDTNILGHLPTVHTVANNGWPVLLSFFFLIFHFNNFIDYMTLQRVISISISVLTIIPVYLLCKRFTGKSYAILGAAIFAFEPHLIQNSLLGITEPLYIGLIVTSLVLFLSSNKKLTYISFGVIALASLVRIEGFALFFAFSIMFFVRSKKERNTIIQYLLVLGIFILFLLPMVVFRIESNGTDTLTSRLLGEAHGIISTHGGEVGLGLEIASALKLFIRFLASSMLPIFIFFVPVGAYLIFKKRNQENVTIIVVIILMLFASFYAYFSLASDTRYIYPLFPLFCILSLFTIKSLADRITKRNIFLVLLVGGILLSSLLFLHFKNTDIEYEKEALNVSHNVVVLTSGINPYSTASEYIPITEMSGEKFPILSTSISVGPKIISTNGFNSLIEYIKFGKENGLTHLVLDDSKRGPLFLTDVFYHEEKYPYLVKIYDSWDHGYKYHLKIYKINYEIFSSLITKNLQ